MLVASLMMILSIFASNGLAATITFKDIPKQYWAYEEISWAVDKGLVKGYSDGTFRPSQLLTESQFVSVFTRYLKPELTANVLPKDQSTIQYSYLQDLNVVLPGHLDHSQKKEPTSRLVMARALYEAIGKTGDDDDVVDWMYDTKLTNGKGISTDRYVDFGGEDNLYRVHVAAFFQRADKQGYLKQQADNIVVFTERMTNIQAMWNTLKPRFEGDLFVTKPTFTSLGKMQDGHLQDALNMTNFVRYLSFLPSDIRLNEQHSIEAQAASQVNAANKLMTHYPVKPVGMDDTLYNLGKLGASTSNIGYGYSDLVDSIVTGYMDDSGLSNRDRVGHRRWILSPRLQEVGFGFAYDTNNVPHTAMKVISPNMRKNTSTPYTFIAWPSNEAFPTSFFEGSQPWSLSLNESEYDNSQLEEVSVKLTRVNDQKTWTLTKNTDTDGFFTIDTGNSGYTPYTIIFHPDRIKSYQNGDKFEVLVSGIYTLSGEKTSLRYETTFFNLK